MRLLWVTENYFPRKGGMAQSCDRLVRQLRATGLTIDVAFCHSGATDLRAEEKTGGTDLVCPTEDVAHGMNLLWSWIEGSSRSYTHVVAFGGATPIVVAPVLAAWLKAPLVTLIRGNDFDAAVFHPTRSAALREALARSARVCVVSRDKGARIEALAPGTEVTWIPNGIVLEDWKALPSDVEKARDWRRDAVAGERRVLGLFGHLKRKKGSIFFLEALLASGRAEACHVLLVGEMEPALVEWLAGPGAGIARTTVPFMDRYALIPYYLACDYTVIPSWYDGMPNVLLESAALGIPLLASRTGGMADVLQDGTHGHLFPPGDRHRCAALLGRIVDENAADRAAMGLSCRALVAEQLEASRETARYRALFEETTTRRMA